jgi:hypothetical protein
MGGLGVALVVDVVDDMFMLEEPVAVLNDDVKDDEVLLADKLESLEVCVALLDDPDSVLLTKPVGTLLEESDNVLVCEKLVLPDELDKETLLIELDVSGALDNVLLERLSVDAVDDKELVGEMDDEDMEAPDELLEGVVESVIDISLVTDGDTLDELLDELLERVDVSTSLTVLDELP